MSAILLIKPNFNNILFGIEVNSHGFTSDKEFIMTFIYKKTLKNLNKKCCSK